MNVIAFLMLLWTVALVTYTFFAVRDMLHYVENNMVEESLNTPNKSLDEEK